MSLDVTQDAGPGDLVTTGRGQGSEGSQVTHYSKIRRETGICFANTLMDKCVILLDVQSVRWPEPLVRSSSDIWSQVKMFTESRANAHLLHYSSHYLAQLSKVCPVRTMTTFYNNNIYTDHPRNIAHCQRTCVSV